MLRETSIQLLAEVREPLPPQPGRPRRQDYEYRRGGTRNIFLTCEPLAGWRHPAITEWRTMPDFAHQRQWLVDVTYPDATVVRVVLDNLSTHRMASLYETFPPAEARRIVKRLEFHHMSIINTAALTRLFRRGCSGRPCRRPVSSGPGARSRGWERRSGPCALPCRRARCGR